MECFSNIKPVISQNTRAVYQTLAYFDIFKYPLKFIEIINFCPCKIDDDSLRLELSTLIEAGKVYLSNGYYFLSTTDSSVINDRIENERRLESKMVKIKRYAAIINSFPFVRAVLVSGSVSKGVLSKDGDVDYFIIAEKGRVWLCRTMLIFFKKVFLLNSKKYFCVNYFVDTANLKVPDTNLFVATEIKTLIPVEDNVFTRQFNEANKWTDNVFPNNNNQPSPFYFGEKRRPMLSELIESICSSSLGEKLDDYLFKKTLQRWQKKFPHFDKKEFDVNMRSYKSVSKHHPQGNQARVLEALALRMSNLEKTL